MVEWSENHTVVMGHQYLVGVGVCVQERIQGGGAKGALPPPPPHKKLLPQIVRRGSRGAKRALPPPYKILDPPMVSGMFFSFHKGEHDGERMESFFHLRIGCISTMPCGHSFIYFTYFPTKIPVGLHDNCIYLKKTRRSRTYVAA